MESIINLLTSDVGLIVSFVLAALVVIESKCTVLAKMGLSINKIVREGVLGLMLFPGLINIGLFIFGFFAGLMGQAG